MSYKCKNDIKVARKLLTAIGHRMYLITNDLYSRCELGTIKEDQGKKFTHKKNYEKIKRDCSVLSDLYNMIYNFTTDDNTCFSKCVTEKTFKKQLQDLCDYCGIKDGDI